MLAPFDDVVAGRDSKDVIHWSDELLCAFRYAQKALSSTHAITLPRPADQLWIVTDGAVREPGLGATLYITYSKPCIQAFEKLCRGEFSASPRVTSFLSTASRFQVLIRHVAGAAILPSDFASRNAPECESPTCQVCTFIRNTADSVVRQVTAEGVMRGAQKLPFTNRSAWLALQSECSDLRRTCAHLRQGLTPGFAALAGDEVLAKHRLVIEVGNAKTSTKTQSLRRLFKSFKHDQFSNRQLPVNDQELIMKQHSQRVTNHPYSVRSKTPSGRVAAPPTIRPGDLVYLYGDQNKSKACDRYLVTGVDDAWCNIRKFTGTQLRRTSYRV
ncbi:hypothetical protein AAFF_G00199510, partial [Aldrovandia affinis]